MNDNKASSKRSSSVGGSGKKGRATEDPAVSFQSLMDAGVIKHMVENSYLTVREAGRLLLCTSKAITNMYEGTTQRDEKTRSSEPWKALCVLYWGKEKFEELMNAGFDSAVQLFRTMVYPAPVDRCPQPAYEGRYPPPEYNPSDLYTLIVDLQDHKTEKSLFSCSVRGHAIPGLFSQNASWEVSVARGKVDLLVEFQKMESTMPTYFNFIQQVTAKVGLVRKQDRRVVTLLNQSSCNLYFTLESLGGQWICFIDEAKLSCPSFLALMGNRLAVDCVQSQLRSNLTA